MVAPDWGCVDASRNVALPDDRDDLLDRYVTSDLKSMQLVAIFDHMEELTANRVVVEAPYVDFDYRSEYANLYSRSFNPPSDKNERLLFFSDQRFLGFVVVRPSVKPVGRTAIAPPPSVAPFVACTAPHVVRPWGQRFEVEGWPYLSQDGVYGRCAHAAIWSIARYHHLRHGAPRHSLAAVVEASGTKSTVDRTSRSSGLYLPEVADAFAGLGLPVMHYWPEKLPSGQDLEAIVCRYLNSGFPIALSTPNHLSVLIGYGHKDEKLFFIRSDDNVDPYERVDEWTEGRDRLQGWDAILVPLPGRIHVPGESAENRAIVHFLEQAGAIEETAGIYDRLLANEYRRRTYAVEAAEYKARLAGRGVSDELLWHHQRTPASVWIWVTEIQIRDATSRDQSVIGEIAIDATSHPRRPQPLFANMPGRVIAWPPDQAAPLAKSISFEDAYASALEPRIDR